MDIKKLRMLAELERLGTIAAVARELGQTAPGVSMQLAALEREVGLQLTERNGRNVALTPAGRLLARHGHDIVDMLTLAEGAANALRDGAAGTYRLAAFPSIARTVVADTWATIIADDHDDIRLELVELEPRDSLPALAAGEVHLALTHSYSNLSEDAPDDVEATEIAVEPVWLAIRADDPVLARQEGAVDLALLAHHDWVLPHPQWPSSEMVQRACSLAGFTPTTVAQTSDFSVIAALVAAGAGVALVPHLAVAAVPDGVVLRALAAPVFRHDFVVMRHATGADPGAIRVRDLLVASAARMMSLSRASA